MNKITKIEGFEMNKFQGVLSQLLKNLDYTEIEIVENYLTAIKKSPLSVEKYVFIIFPFQLSGQVDVQKISDIIQKVQIKATANTVFVVSKYHISNGFEKAIISELTTILLNFLGRDRLIKLIDVHYCDLWKHDDTNLLEYEKQFLVSVSQDTELRQLKLSNDKCQKLLDIYIEPKLQHFYEDKKTNTPTRKRVETADVINDKKSIVISGRAGAGKSTLLKKIGKLLIEKNIENQDKKNLPIYLTTSEIYNSNYSINQIVNEKLSLSFNDELSTVIQSYNINILIDSIDEFEEDVQKKFLRDIQNYSETNSIKYIIGTRNSDKVISLSGHEKLNTYRIDRFNADQVKKFVSSFFIGDEYKANNLLDALRENKIIDRLPITPLTLSLISILYEENNFEIPATITDIYDNFNALIIGKAVVSNKIEFIDISFKERIISLYALKLLEIPQHTPLTKDDFLQYFKEYFAEKTIPIKKGTLEDVLLYLVQNTGVLYLKDNIWVNFSHDSYMEYYAALEIFKHQREKEQLLVDNFFDSNWQNAAVFYVGKSKDMPVFTTKIKEKLSSARHVNEFLSGILGSGYLLQALYQTDNKLRKDVVLEALELIVKTNEVFMKLASDDTPMFKNYKLPILQLMNLFFFYESFNSITVKEPLKISFKELMTQYKETHSPTIGYKLIQLAFTLDSKRINESAELEEVVDNSDILKDPILFLLTDFSIDCFGKEKYKDYKAELKKKYNTLKLPLKELSEKSAAKLRFTNLDVISAAKSVTIVVEGKTDAEIIEHAYYVLTKGQPPYWKIRTSGNTDSGCATEVAKTLLSSYPVVDEKHTVIGLFDHDSKGLHEFRRLSSDVFEFVVNNTIRKHKKANIYALCLPIPGEMDIYLQEKQEFNFFEIEHYFGFEFLNSKDMLKATAIPDIYEISDKRSAKSTFSSEIRKYTDPELFKYFISLFKYIDKITKVEIEYSI